MTIITIDNIALVKVLEPLTNVLFFIVIWILSYTLFNIFIDMYLSNKKNKRLEESNQLYVARKRHFEDNPKGWKDWRDANYKITDLVEANNYY